MKRKFTQNCQQEFRYGWGITCKAGKPTSSKRVVPFWVKRNPQNLQHVVDGIEAGKFAWEIDSTFPFEKAAEAYSKILEGHTRGKIVITF
ncbi:zinc-binding dehydrogenase [Sphingobacterium sp. BN32]|uniref:zinc-binding dehydrogenase n=1 Tax=Sphingobacterium sp. BN32 TaxID=3058432 RepID=UPI00265D2094|nr:zinc-binding dehydrogenase [Sphingobacterium sp. BN32]WKK59902.1 zinc-binding dehydrogenase [Sphingobacterium sp. BN32]